MEPLLELVKQLQAAGIGNGPLLVALVALLTWAEVRFRKPWVAENQRRARADESQEARLRLLCREHHIEEKDVALERQAMRAEAVPSEPSTA